MRPARSGLAVLLSTALAFLPLCSAAQDIERVSLPDVSAPAIASPLSIPNLPNLSVPALPQPVGAEFAVPAPTAEMPEQAQAATAAETASAQATQSFAEAWMRAGQPKPAQAAVARAAAIVAQPRAQQGSGWARFWNGSREQTPVAARWMPALAAAPLAAAHHALLPHWASPYLTMAKPLGTAGLVLGATYAVHRGVRLTIEKLAKRGNWDPNVTDTVRFTGMVATWALGMGIGIHLAGVSATTVMTTYTVAITAAIKTMVTNLMYAVFFLMNRPFVIGDTVRMGDRLFHVEDMQLQYVKMRVLGQLTADQPATVPPGFVAKPFKEVDPLGRDADDKGNKWVTVRVNAPGETPAQPGPAATPFARMDYSYIAGNTMTLFRAYDHGHARKLDALRRLDAFASGLRDSRAKARDVLQSIKESPHGLIVKGVLWMLAAAALVPLMPIIKAHLAFQALGLILQAIHGLAVLMATRYAARFSDRFLTILGKKIGWGDQAAVVTKFLTQVVIYSIGLSSGLRASGLQWSSIFASLGVTAAASTLLYSNVLGNVGDAVRLRFSRQFRVGQTVRIGETVGVVKEMNMFYVVVQVGNDAHTLIPYSVIDSNYAETYDPAEGAPRP